VALNAVLLLSPPLQLSDFYNYLGYARLGALHGLNPYSNVFAQASHDPIYRFTTWHHLRSPYGPLFTAATYPLAFLPLPVAYWVAKFATVLASLAFLGLVWHCARRLGRDPRLALVFVALNPIFLIYALGGFHNDFFMLVPAIGAIALVLARRDKAAGAALAVAVAIKFSAILLLPFLLLGAPGARRRLSVLAGAALATIPLVLLSLAMFGFALPNLSAQTTLLTAYSIPNLLGDAIGAGGGAPWLLHLGDVAVALTVAWMLVRNRDWIAGAGWATLVLVATLGWLLPWYVVWVLPLAALGTSARLRAWTLAMSAFLILTFVPATGIFLRQHGVNTMTGAAGNTAWQRQRLLER
jgi:alpha-1,6-mannosyltransferase